MRRSKKATPSNGASLARRQRCVSLSSMNTHQAKTVKRLCWLLLAGIFVFHFWADGRNATLMQELQRHGATAANAREELHWLCAPLNVAALAVLLLIATLSYRTRLGRITKGSSQ